MTLKDEVRGIFQHKILPRLKHQDMTPADFYGIHYKDNPEIVVANKNIKLTIQ